MSSENDIKDVIIIGSGPAGYTAAVYTARANLKPLMISGNSEGGQLMITTDVDNFPGFPEGIIGPSLIQNMKQQAQRFGTEIITTDATKVDFSKRPFTIQTDLGKEYKAKTVIIATGAKARLLDIPSEKRFMGFGVSACATCDGFFFKDKHVIVVGGGDSAMEEATFLTKFAKKVTIVHRRDKLRASKIMQERAMKNDKIDFVWNSTIAEILGEESNENGIANKKVTGVKLHNRKTDEIIEMSVDGVFMAIGHTPNTQIFEGQINLDEKKYIKPTVRTYTNIEGVFACGDVVDSYYRQAITAAGSGCQAAIDAERWLEAQEA
jgi:thioredoxin reductase (NADPH)